MPTNEPAHNVIPTREARRMRITPGGIALICLLIGFVFRANAGGMQLEKQIIKYIASDAFSTFQADQQCHEQTDYRVYLIDNFEQSFDIVPEVRTSHGEMLVRLLRAGRNDIDIRVLNTSLSKGLAIVINELIDGGCADAVVSSTPGSNYTYDQISTLFLNPVQIKPENILFYRSELKQILRSIAFHGFPSVEWLENVDVNAVKLRNDARKFAFIEAVGRFNIPVILPYGNADARYKGHIKSVNLLSLAANAKVYSALGQEGDRVAGYPYSPLSTGDEPAVYGVVECPHPEDPFKACLDINNDGYQDYTFFRRGKIAFHDAEGELSFAPPVLPQHQFAALMGQIEKSGICRIEDEMVLTADQFKEASSICPDYFNVSSLKSYVWLNASGHAPFYSFDAQCWKRGKISGTSVIPPQKIKELLPPKMGKGT